MFSQFYFASFQEKDTFFAWCDGYVAASEGEEVDIGFTLLSEDKNLAHSISSVNIPENQIVSVVDYELTEMDEKYKMYGFYSIVAKVIFNAPGNFSFDHLELNYYDGHSEEYRVGTWTFDVESEDDGSIYTWESPMASALSDNFSYDYSIEDPAISSCVIYTGMCDPVYVERKSDRNLTGKIDISASKAPIKYIRSKLVYSVNRVECVTFGEGCYCGALGFDETDIELSRQHNK